MSKANMSQPLLPAEMLGGGGNSLSKEACLINGSQEEDADGYEPPYESQEMSNKLTRGRKTEAQEDIPSS